MNIELIDESLRLKLRGASANIIVLPGTHLKHNIYKNLYKNKALKY